MSAHPVRPRPKRRSGHHRFSRPARGARTPGTNGKLGFQGYSQFGREPARPRHPSVRARGSKIAYVSNVTHQSLGTVRRRALGSTS